LSPAEKSVVAECEGQQSISFEFRFAFLCRRREGGSAERVSDSRVKQQHSFSSSKTWDISIKKHFSNIHLVTICKLLLWLVFVDLRRLLWRLFATFFRLFFSCFSILFWAVTSERQNGREGRQRLQSQAGRTGRAIWRWVIKHLFYSDRFFAIQS
jgi:hypothetical protein